MWEIRMAHTGRQPLRSGSAGPTAPPGHRGLLRGRAGKGALSMNDGEGRIFLNMNLFFFFTICFEGQRGQYVVRFSWVLLLSTHGGHTSFSSGGPLEPGAEGRQSKRCPSLSPQ
jgi:hypothetical protein